MRKFLIIGVVVAVLGVGGWFAYQRFVLPAQNQAQEPAYETVQVKRGNVASTVSATGNIEPEAEVSLLFRGAGPVARVLVAEGDAVKDGQLLAELETTDQTLALAQSKVAQEISEAQLKKLEAPPDAMDVAAAQAAVEVAQAGVASAEASQEGARSALVSAQASYSDLVDDVTDVQRTINTSQVRQAETNLKQAQQRYDKIKEQPDAGMMPQAVELEQATINYEVAKAQVAKTEEPATQAAIAQALNQIAQATNQIAQAQSAFRQAQAQVVNAQNSLDNLLDGPKAEDIQIARAQVKQAQLNQLQAENALANSRIVAPFDGVISKVNVKEGEQSANGQPAVVLTDLSIFHMKVLVDEVDVRQVAVGQPVRLSVDALPGVEITGTVTQIAPTAANVNNVVAYEVTIVPDATDAPLRAGMSATAIVTTADVDDAILVPNRYISLDRDTGKATVYKMVAGKPVLQEVELGLRNERESQVLAGLQDGDEIALVTQSGAEQLRGALFGGGE